MVCQPAHPLAPVRRHLVDLAMKRPGADAGAAVAADEDPPLVGGELREMECLRPIASEAQKLGVGMGSRQRPELDRVVPVVGPDDRTGAVVRMPASVVGRSVGQVATVPSVRSTTFTRICPAVASRPVLTTRYRPDLSIWTSSSCVVPTR